MTAWEDESLERELFALRARVIPTPRLDLDDVMARANRRDSTKTSRFTAWIGAAACAAASYLGVAAHEPVHTDDAAIAGASMSYFDGLSCRADVPDAIVSEPGMCVAPKQLVCE